MSLIQRLLMRVLPERCAQDLKASSESWRIVCGNCGDSRSVWEAGGVRWRARSAGKRVWQRCPGCELNSWAAVERIEAPHNEKPGKEKSAGGR
jgi:hypothetical protein